MDFIKNIASKKINQGGENIFEFHLQSKFFNLNAFYKDLKKELKLKTPTVYDEAHLKLMDDGKSDAQPVSDYHWEMYDTKFGLMMLSYWYKKKFGWTSYKGLHFFEDGSEVEELSNLRIVFVFNSSSNKKIDAADAVHSFESLKFMLEELSSPHQAI